jgi:hypothetical protein
MDEFVGSITSEETAVTPLMLFQLPDPSVLLKRLPAVEMA